MQIKQIVSIIIHVLEITLEIHPSKINRPLLLDDLDPPLQRGLRTDPWCTPILTLKALLSLPFSRTFVVASSYIALITHTIHSSTPKYLSAHHTTSLGSRHPIKCILQVHKSHPKFVILCQIFLLQLTDYENSICRAPTHHKSKLHAVNFYNLSHSPFNHSFQHLHCVLLYASVRATCQGITLSFVNIQLLLQSSGILPSFTTALHTSVIHNVPIFTCSLKHLRHM